MSVRLDLNLVLLCLQVQRLSTVPPTSHSFSNPDLLQIPHKIIDLELGGTLQMRKPRVRGVQ